MVLIECLYDASRLMVLVLRVRDVIEVSIAFFRCHSDAGDVSVCVFMTARVLRINPFGKAACYKRWDLSISDTCEFRVEQNRRPARLE